MPVPNEALIAALALPSFTSQVNPQAGPRLGGALGKVVGRACERFAGQVFMAPGVVSNVVPPVNVGVLTGVGRLEGGVPSEAEVRMEAEDAVRGLGVPDAERARFVEAVSKLTTRGLERFRDLGQVPPGTPVAGGVTAAPARLVVPVGSITAELTAMARSMNPPRPPTPGAWVAARPGVSRPGTGPLLGGHRGGAAPPAGPPRIEIPEDMAGITASILGKVFEQMASTLMVAPGVVLGGPVTAAPGRLI